MKDLLNLNSNKIKNIFNDDGVNNSVKGDILNILVDNTCFDETKVKVWAKKNNATELFLNLWDIYNNLYTLCGNVNPIVAYIQAAIETDFGNFNGDLKENFNNPYGVKEFKYSDDGILSEEYTKFKSWEEGIEAHLDHLALYVGAEGYPKEDSKDTRHFYYLYGICSNIDDLQGKWTAKKNYSNRILDEINNIFSDSNYRSLDNSTEIKELRNENNDMKEKLDKYKEIIESIKKVLENEIE